jgi:hypothetical protein
VKMVSNLFSGELFARAMVLEKTK